MNENALIFDGKIVLFTIRYTTAQEILHPVFILNTRNEGVM